MSVFFSDEKKLFHLSNSVYSYLFKLDTDGMITDLYFGDPYDMDDISHSSLYTDESFFESNLLTASNGKMPYRRPITLYHIQVIDGVDLNFKYVGQSVSAEIVPGEGNLEESYAENLNIFFHCDETNTDLITTYSVIASYPIIARRISLFQNGEHSIHVFTNAEHLEAYNGNHNVISFDLPTKDIDFTLHPGESFHPKDLVALYQPQNG